MNKKLIRLILVCIVIISIFFGSSLLALSDEEISANYQNIQQTKTLKLVDVYRFAGKKFLGITISPDGKQILTRGDNLTLLNIETRKAIWTLEPYYKGFIFHLAAFSTIDTVAVTEISRRGTSEFSNIYVFDKQSGKKIQEFKIYGYPFGIIFSPDGKFLLVGDNTGRVRLLDIGKGRKIWTCGENILYCLIHHGCAASPVVFSPDGRLALISGIGRIYIVDVVTKKYIKTKSINHSGLDVFSLSSDGRFLLSHSRTLDEIKLWNFITGREIWTHNIEEKGDRIFNILTFSPDNRLAISVSDKGMLTIWDVSTGEKIDRINPKTHGIKVVSAAFSPDGKLLYVDTANGDILQFELVEILLKGYLY